MVKKNGTAKIQFRSLPPQARQRACRSPLLVQAQRRYLQSHAPLIDNNRYWAKIGVKFETDRLNDTTLVLDISMFLDILGNPEKAVIEFGCGIGRTADLLVDDGFHDYTGIDICEKVVQLARERLPGLEFLTNDILTYQSVRHFDAAIVTDVLLYLSPEQQLQALLNLNSLLKPGAPVMIRWAPGNNEVRINQPKEVDGEHLASWVFLASPEYIQNLLRVSGFTLTRPIDQESHTINQGTKYEKLQDYLMVLAEKTA